MKLTITWKTEVIETHVRTFDLDDEEDKARLYKAARWDGLTPFQAFTRAMDEHERDDMDMFLADYEDKNTLVNSDVTDRRPTVVKEEKD